MDLIKNKSLMSSSDYYSSFEMNDFDNSNNYTVEVNQNCSYDNSFEEPNLPDKSGAEFEWDSVDYGGSTVDDGLF